MEVDPHDLLDLVGVEREDMAPFGHRRVVDEHVDPVEAVPRLVAEAIDHLVVTKVGGPRGDFGTESATVFGDSFESRFVATRNCQ